jgi:hypothetical protein
MATKLIYPAYDGFVGAVLDMQTCDYDYSRRKSNAAVYYSDWLLMRRAYNPSEYVPSSTDIFVRAFIDFDISLPGGC